MNLNEINTKIDELDNKSWDMDLVIGRVNDKTKEIKYNDVHSNIYMEKENLTSSFLSKEIKFFQQNLKQIGIIFSLVILISLLVKPFTILMEVVAP